MSASSSPGSFPPASSLIHSWFQTLMSETLFETSVRQEPRTRLYISKRVVLYIRCRVYKGAVHTQGLCRWKYVENARLAKEEGWDRSDHVKTKSWYFSWCVKVSMLAGSCNSTALCPAKLMYMCTLENRSMLQKWI